LAQIFLYQFEQRESIFLADNIWQHLSRFRIVNLSMFNMYPHKQFQIKHNWFSYKKASWRARESKHASTSSSLIKRRFFFCLSCFLPLTKHPIKRLLLPQCFLYYRKYIFKLFFLSFEFNKRKLNHEKCTITMYP
jgi:hypothetical protein